jgi:hypothetical protein
LCAVPLGYCSALIRTRYCVHHKSTIPVLYLHTHTHTHTQAVHCSRGSPVWQRPLPVIVATRALWFEPPLLESFCRHLQSSSPARLAITSAVRGNDGNQQQCNGFIYRFVLICPTYRLSLLLSLSLSSSVGASVYRHSRPPSLDRRL